MPPTASTIRSGGIPPPASTWRNDGYSRNPHGPGSAVGTGRHGGIHRARRRHFFRPGNFHCTNPSPMGAKLQIAAAVVQGGTRLAFGGGEAECDGQEHEWEATGSLKFTPAVHPGPALAEAQLNEIHFSGLMPRSIDTVAEDRQEIRLIAHH
ncbi:DUF6299 family protein [Streptomyces sp. NBC_01546]|uniref:DUF6299 family protein n=1 Tax=Streptomyces sp. NBC_01546 TaxID=2975872 RepID=UPI003868A692